MAEFSRVLKRRRKPKKESISAAGLKKIYADHQRDRMAKQRGWREFRTRWIGLARFALQRRLEKIALAGGNPPSLTGKVVNHRHPDDQPNDRQGSLGNQKDSPVPASENPAREGRRNNERQREAQHPER